MSARPRLSPGRWISWLHQHYGGGPLHLALSVACLSFAGYLVWIIVPAANSVRIFAWIAIAAAIHDLLLWPLYAVLDRVSAWAHHRQAHRDTRVPWINHVRVPVVLSAVMLLISFPLVLRHSERAYHTASGLSEQPYLRRWLFLSGSAFATSALIYLARVLRNRVRKAAQ